MAGLRVHPTGPERISWDPLGCGERPRLLCLPMTVPKGKVRKAREEGGSSNECEIWKVNPLGSWKRPGCTEWGYWKYASSLRDSTYSSCTRLSGRGGVPQEPTCAKGTWFSDSQNTAHLFPKLGSLWAEVRDPREISKESGETRRKRGGGGGGHVD